MKILNENKVYDGKFIKIINAQFKNKNGNTGNWEYMQRPGGGAVGALVEHMDNQSYILVEQYRIPLKTRVLELVAGLIDKAGKTNEEIMREEIEEEVGYIAQKIEFITQYTNSAGCSGETSYQYYAQVHGKQGSQKLGEHEDIEVIETPKNDIIKMMLSKEKQGILVSPSIEAVLYRVENMKKKGLLK